MTTIRGRAWLKTAVLPVPKADLASGQRRMGHILNISVTMAVQIVVTEKTSQAKDIRMAVGMRYGAILPADEHLFELLEPGEALADWQRWSPIRLRPDGLYGAKPAVGGDKAGKCE